MPTLKQKKAAELTLETLLKGRNLNWKQILERAGYSPDIQDYPSKVYKSKGFQEIIAKNAPDKVKKYLERIDEIALSKKDARNALKAIRTYFELLGLFEEKVRLGALKEREDLFVDEQEYENIQREGIPEENRLEAPSKSGENPQK